MPVPTSQRMTAQQAAALIEPRDSLGLPLGPGAPPALLTALGQRDDWVDLRVFGALLLGLYPLFTRAGVRLRSGFFGPVERGLRAAGHDVQFVPADFRRFTRLLAELCPRVMTTLATPPDERGWMSLSLHAGATTHELHAAGRDPDRLLLVEVNPYLPRTLGLEPDASHALHLDEVDGVIEAPGPLPVLPVAPAGACEARIAREALRFVRPGATLQTGIGGIPGAIVSCLAESGPGDFGVHSEMFTDGLMRLHRAGRVSNKGKGLYEGFSVCTFAGGSEELYRWLDRNREVRFLPVEVVNAPEVIARNRDMVCINGALAVDLQGQVAADTLGPSQYSGIGGHEDFTSSSGLGSSGRSLVCLPSTAQAKGRTVSRIVPFFEAGTTVTTPRHQVDLIVTEHGAAELAGRTTEERAEALVAIAHPDFRDSLRRAARC